MPSYVSILLLAMAVSLDSFGVGLNYGLRRIMVPIGSTLIISFCSGMVMLISMLMGALILPLVPERYAGWIGGAILIGIGLWAFVQMSRQQQVGDKRTAVQQERNVDQLQAPRRIFHLEIKRAGIVIDILRTPASADMDRSGTISAGEAALLGAALSLDAFGAGIGAALIDLAPWVTAPVIALFCAIFLQLGLHAGKLASGASWMSRLSFVPGIILIMLGLSKFLQ